MNILKLACLLAVFILLSGNSNGQTLSPNCISFSNTTAKVVNKNSVYSMVSWKTQATNSCSDPIFYDFTLKAFDANQLELDRSRQYDYYIPANSSLAVSSSLLLSSSKTESLSAVNIAVDRTKKATSHIIGDLNNCLNIQQNKPSQIVKENTVYQQRSWQAKVSNRCNENYLADFTYQVLDIDNYEIDSNRKYDAYIPANRTVTINYSDLLSPTALFSSIGREVIQIIRAEPTVKKPLKMLDFHWLPSALSYFSDIDGKLITDVKAPGIGMFRLNLSNIPHASEIQFRLNENSLVELNAETRGISVFNTETNMLRVPAAEVTLGQQLLILEDLNFRLIDPERWLFRLEDFVEYGRPYSSLEGADDCLSLSTPRSALLVANSAYSEVSFAADILNKCDREFRLDVEFTAYNADGFILDDSREYDLKILPNSSTLATSRMLISPPELEKRMAKAGVSISVR